MASKFICALVTCIMLALPACQDAGVRKQVQDLDYAINEYAYALRWSRNSDAVDYHMKPDGSKPAIDLGGLDVIRITGFTIREKNVNEDITRATVKGELNYYHNDYGTLRTLDYDQSWWYEPETGKWYIDSAFPQFP